MSDNSADAPIKIFVAMSFRDKDEPALVDYWHAMQRAGERANGNYVLNRIDHVEGDYEIIERIEEEIDSCDVVIADLTLMSANVVYELGFARGRNKYIIQTCREGTKLEFDIRGRRTLMYSNATNLEEKLLRHLNSLKLPVR